MNQDRDILLLFDVDGTLTRPREVIENNMVEKLKELRKKAYIGFVGGSNLEKQQEQLNGEALVLFDYAFPENGLEAYKNGERFHQESFIEFLGEEKYMTWVDYVLRYIADLKLPKKRGTFVEFRKGLINVSPIGRNCSPAERKDFAEYDKIHKIREKFVKDLERKFEGFGLQYSIGGQISFDVFPMGWDKTYCLRHLEKDKFKAIHFFGDKVEKGGNDYEIMNHPDVIGHAVTSPEDTISILEELFKGESARA